MLSAEQRQAAQARAIAFGLTPRECEIVALLLTGTTARLAIADALGLDANTVKHHLTGMYSKVGVQDRTQLVVRLLGGR